MNREEPLNKKRIAQIARVVCVLAILAIITGCLGSRRQIDEQVSVEPDVVATAVEIGATAATAPQPTSTTLPQPPTTIKPTPLPEEVWVQWPPENPIAGSGEHIEVFRSGEYPLYVNISIEERIAISDVVARAEYLSAEMGARNVGGSYLPVVRYKFLMLEHLKGSSNSEVIVETTILEPLEWLEHQDALKTSGIVLGNHKHWYDREMVLMLLNSSRTHFSNPITDNSAIYVFAGPGNQHSDRFMVGSKENVAWFPATNGVAGSDNQQFITELLNGSASGTVSATMSLREFKQLVNRVDVRGSEQTDQTKLSECARRRYASGISSRQYEDPETLVEFAASSGAASGTVFHTSDDYGVEDWGYSIDFLTGDLGGVVVTEIIDDDEDPVNGYETRWSLNRPVPMGTYANYFKSTLSVEALIELSKSNPCFVEGEYSEMTLDELKAAQPESNDKWNITVTAPPDTVHEAFFDPGADGAAHGYEQDSYGRFEPATAEGIDFAVSKLTWQDGQVSMATTGSQTLSAHSIDFINLDGETVLSLPIDSTSAVEGVSGGYSWCVTEQPWKDGDLLMARIRLAGATGASSAGAPICLEPTATPNATSMP